MMLKIIIGAGSLLMLVGFGSAGLQYWQNRPQAEAMVAEIGPGGEPAGALQTWLISPTGGQVPRDDVRAYLVHDRFVEGRSVAITHTAALGAVLLEGEKLPERPYLEVLADIRAPKVAQGFCAILIETIAQDCVVQSARVVKGSVDPVAGTARFQTGLVFRLKRSDEALPDLATHVFATQSVTFDGAGPDSAGALLAATVAQATAACAAQRRTEACRILRLTLDWDGADAATGGAEIGSMSPLPKGIIAAPPLG